MSYQHFDSIVGLISNLISEIELKKYDTHVVMIKEMINFITAEYNTERLKDIPVPLAPLGLELGVDEFPDSMMIVRAVLDSYYNMCHLQSNTEDPVLGPIYPIFLSLLELYTEGTSIGETGHFSILSALVARKDDFFIEDFLSVADNGDLVEWLRAWTPKQLNKIQTKKGRSKPHVTKNTWLRTLKNDPTKMLRNPDLQQIQMEWTPYAATAYPTLPIRTPLRLLYLRMFLHVFCDKCLAMPDFQYAVDRLCQSKYGYKGWINGRKKIQDIEEALGRLTARSVFTVDSIQKSMGRNTTNNLTTYLKRRDNKKECDQMMELLDSSPLREPVEEETDGPTCKARSHSRSNSTSTWSSLDRSFTAEPMDSETDTHGELIAVQEQLKTLKRRMDTLEADHQIVKKCLRTVTWRSDALKKHCAVIEEAALTFRSIREFYKDQPLSFFRSERLLASQALQSAIDQKRIEQPINSHRGEIINNTTLRYEIFRKLLPDEVSPAVKRRFGPDTEERDLYQNYIESVLICAFPTPKKLSEMSDEDFKTCVLSIDLD